MKTLKKMRGIGLSLAVIGVIAIGFGGCASSSFKEAQQLNTVQAYDKFLKEYPDDKEYTHIAKKLREETLFEDVKAENTLSAYDKYFREYPSGKFVDESKKLRDKKAFEDAKNINTVDSYKQYYKQAYSSKYILGEYIKTAKRLQDSIELNTAKSINTVEAYDYYLNNCNFCEQELIKELKEPLIFEKAKEINKLSNYESYLNLYPYGVYKQQVLNLKEPLLFEKVKNENTLKSYNKYLLEYPKGKFIQEVNVFMEPLIFEEAKYNNSYDSLNNYLKQYPKGKFITEVQKIKETLLFNEAKNENSYELFKKYTEEYPKGKYINEVKNTIEEFEYWKKSLNTRSYQQYIDKYPKGQFVAYAKEMIIQQKLSFLDLGAKIKHDEDSHNNPDIKINETFHGSSKQIKNLTLSWSLTTSESNREYCAKTGFLGFCASRAYVKNYIENDKEFGLKTSNGLETFQSRTTLKEACSDTLNLVGYDKLNDAIKKIYVNVCNYDSFETEVKNINVYIKNLNKIGLYYYSRFDYTDERNIYNENNEVIIKASFSEVTPIVKIHKQFKLKNNGNFLENNTNNKKVLFKENTIFKAVNYAPELEQYLAILPYDDSKFYWIHKKDLNLISVDYIESEYKKAISNKNIENMNYVLKYYPDSIQRQVALKVLLQEYAKTDTTEIYDQYIKLYPDSVVLSEAKEKRFYADLKVKTDKELYFVAGKYERDKDFYNAKRVYDYIVEKRTDSKYAEKANDNLLAIVKLEAYKDAKEKAERETRYAIEQAQNEAERRQNEYSREQKNLSKQQCESQQQACYAGCTGLSTKGWFDDKSSCESKCRSMCY